MAELSEIDDSRPQSMPPQWADRMETMTMNWTRRSVSSGAAVMGSTLIVKPLQAAEYRFSQYHNQAASGTLHKNLTAMWEAVRAETNGRVETIVYPENNRLPGGDPDALKMLISGEIQFF